MVIKGKQIILQDLVDHQELLGLENLLLGDVESRRSEDQKRAKSSKMLRSQDEEDEDEYLDEEDDPQYMLILQNLKENDKSYIIEYEEDGLRDAIEYEGASGSDAECDQEPREKPRKQHDGPSNQMPCADTRLILNSPCTPSGEMKTLTSRKTRSKSNRELEEKAKLLRKNEVPQSRRKLRSAAKQTDEHLNRVPDADLWPTPTREMGKLTRKNPRSKSRTERDEDAVKLDSVCHMSRKSERSTNKSRSEMEDIVKLDSVCHMSRKPERSRNKSRSEKEDIAKLDSVCHMSRKPERSRSKSRSDKDDDVSQKPERSTYRSKFDPDYFNFIQNFKPVNGCCVFTFEGAEVVYERKSGDDRKMKEEDDDKSYSDVEIIDSTAFYKNYKGSNSKHRDATGQSEFRQKVIAALRKSFDKQEYKKLRRDIELHKPKERHMDLRGGRERPVGTQEYGKSYLDYHPELREKLSRAHDNLPKRLNLLRGFFLWIKHPEAFCPWLDDECLAVRPRPL